MECQWRIPLDNCQNLSHFPLFSSFLVAFRLDILLLLSPVTHVYCILYTETDTQVATWHKTKGCIELTWLLLRNKLNFLEKSATTAKMRIKKIEKWRKKRKKPFSKHIKLAVPCLQRTCWFKKSVYIQV